MAGNTGPGSQGLGICPVCQLPIATSTRTDSQSFACSFCLRTFTRSDGARRHTKSCPERGDRPIPPEAKRGRKLRACDQCCHLKAQCDGRVPCGRCKARRLECTSGRLCSNHLHRTKDIQKEKPTSDRMKSENDSSLLSFLLNLTEPGGDFAMERAIANEPERDIDGPASRREFTLDLNFDEFINPALLFTNFMDPHLETDLEADTLDFAPPTEVLTLRLNALSTELEQTTLQKPQLGIFDTRNFHNLFTSSRIHHSALILSRKRHFQFPLIHWPTFDLEDACLPLIMAISLTGAAYSQQSGPWQQDAARTKSYYRVADAYVFGRVEQYIEAGYAQTASKEAIEHVQAGLLLALLDTCLNDKVIRRIVISKRLPTLVAALRIFGLVGTRHEPMESWDDFVQRESHIRLVAWTYFTDCLTTVFCNKPPLMAHSELHGHLPCRQEFWDAESPEDFNMRRDEIEDDSVCLNELTSGLLQDQMSDAYAKLNLHHLNAIICGEKESETNNEVQAANYHGLALQPMIFNLHTSPLPSATSHIFLRALDRWQTLWDACAGKVSPEQRRWLGVERNSPGLALLSRRILETNETEEGRKSPYLRRMPRYDYEDIHGFIRHYCC